MTEQTPAVRPRLWSPARVVSVACLAAVVAVVGTVAVAKAVAPRAYSVAGKVKCVNHAGSVGIWVDLDHAKGFFAALQAEPDVSDGWIWSRFTAEISTGGDYSLN